jgi:hypothetical protein
MAINFPGPQQLRIYYTVDAESLGPVQHVMNLNFEASETPPPGTEFADIDVPGRIVAIHPLSTLVSELGVLLKALLSADDATLDHAECWNFEPGTFDATYVSSLTIGIAGTSIVSAVAAAQITYTFRTQEGGIMKLSVMEGSQAHDAPFAYADMNAANQDWVDYFTDDASSFFLARDTSWPLAFLKMFPGQNETLFRKRYRP